jgi:hypothetical protein
MKLHQAKELLHRKRNSNQTQEKAHIFASYSSDKGLISRIDKELKKLNLQRISTPMKK